MLPQFARRPEMALEHIVNMRYLKLSFVSFMRHVTSGATQGTYSWEKKEYGQFAKIFDIRPQPFVIKPRDDSG